MFQKQQQQLLKRDYSTQEADVLIQIKLNKLMRNFEKYSKEELKQKIASIKSVYDERNYGEDYSL
jgi:hypothetical protein